MIISQIQRTDLEINDMTFFISSLHINMYVTLIFFFFNLRTAINTTVKYTVDVELKKKWA